MAIEDEVFLSPKTLGDHRHVDLLSAKLVNAWCAGGGGWSKQEVLGAWLWFRQQVCVHVTTEADGEKRT